MFHDVYNGDLSLTALKMNFTYVLTYGLCGSFMLYYFLEMGLWKYFCDWIKYITPNW